MLKKILVLPLLTSTRKTEQKSVFELSYQDNHNTKIIEARLCQAKHYFVVTNNVTGYKLQLFCYSTK